MAPTPTRIGGYEVQEPLGRGGMGVVYRARDPRDGRLVALKVLLTARSADATLRRRFAREVEAMARLDHPSVVRVHGSGEDQGTPFLVLELLAGGSLEERLARGGPLPPGAAAGLVLPLARALEEAHRLGLVHRDLKPSNVLFDDAGAPRLTDFGLVKDLDPGRTRLSQTGQATGTPGYWSPEQASGDGAAVGPRSDVYGLGALLYAALTGRPPFEGSTLYELAVATVSRPAEAPSLARPGVPPALDAICLRCLAKEPDARYPTCAALADDLEAFLDGASAPSPGGRRGVAIGVAAALGVAALAGVAVGVAARAAGEPPPPAVGAPTSAAPTPLPPVAPAPATPTPLPPVAPEVTPPPREAEGALAEARARLARGEHAAAQALFDEALRLAPPTAEALAGRGQCRAARGDRQGAIDDYTAALALDPRSAPTLVNRAMMRAQSRDPDGALADYTAALEVDPRHVIALAYRGNTHVQRGDAQAALADWSAALELDPRLPFVLFNRGQLRRQTGDLDGVIADLTGALDAGHARRAECLEGRGEARARKGDVDGALADYDAALALNPRAAQALVARGTLLRGRGDARGAARDFAAALELSADLPGADALRAFVREHGP